MSFNISLSYPCQKELMRFSTFSNRKRLASRIDCLRRLHKILPFSLENVTVRNRFHPEDPIVIEIDNEVFRIFPIQSESESKAHRLLEHYLNRSGTYIRKLELVNFPSAIHQFNPLKINQLVLDLGSHTYNPEWFTSIINPQKVMFEVLSDVDSTVSLPLSQEVIDVLETIRILLPPSVPVTYVWIDPSDGKILSEKREFTLKPKRLEDYPARHKENVVLRPVAVYEDPFERRDNGKLVLCETLDLDMTPTSSNHRQYCVQAMQTAEGQAADPKFSMIQKYFVIDKDTQRPLGWPENSDPVADKTRCKYLPYGFEAGYMTLDASVNCRFAGLRFRRHRHTEYSGFWWFQVANCDKGMLEIADQVWMARYILQRTADTFGMLISFAPFAPKPAVGGPKATLEVWFKSREIPDEIESLKVLRRLREGEKKNSNARKLEAIAYNRFFVIKNYIRDTRASADSDPYQLTIKIMEESGFLEEQSVFLDAVPLWE